MSFKDFNALQSDRPGYYKPKEGENRIRIVTEAAAFTDAFNNARFVMFIIDRSDGLVKPFTFGSQIAQGIGALAVSSEYGFDKLPPYDMLINRTGSSLDTKYTVAGARSNSELTQDEVMQIAKLPEIKKLAAKLNEKAGTRVQEGSEDVPPPTDGDIA